MEAIRRTTEDLSRTIPQRALRLCGVGIGVPGLTDARRGVVHLLTNVAGWRNVPLAQRMTRRLGLPVFVDNDANLFTLGEWRFGAGRGARHLVGLTLGTGVGGGLVINGALDRGASGTAGELGHSIIDPGGRRCGCGGRGCLETLVGTAAILELARRAVRRRAGRLRTLVRQARGRITPELVCNAAQRGDASALAIWRTVGQTLGLGVAGLVNLLNPDRVIIGGGVAGAWVWFAPSLIATVRQRAMSVPARAVRIVRAHLGDSAGIVGAAALVWEQSRQG